MEAENEIEKIIQVFINESEHYFKDIIEMNMFEQLFPAIAQTMIKEKKGINAAIGCLYRSHVIGFCGQAVVGIGTAAPFMWEKPT